MILFWKIQIISFIIIQTQRFSCCIILIFCEAKFSYHVIIDKSSQINIIDWQIPISANTVDKLRVSWYISAQIMTLSASWNSHWTFERSCLLPVIRWLEERMQTKKTNSKSNQYNSSLSVFRIRHGKSEKSSASRFAF